MSGWWRRNPFYLWYMLREASCVFITAYALMLLWGLYRLQQGRAAFDAWRDSLAAPASLVFHAVTLALVVYHAWTWFKVMPKTLPRLPLADALVVALGVAGTLACSALILFLA